jgi:hypothetical protein
MRRNNFRFRLQSLLLFTAVVAIALVGYRLWPLDGWMGSLFSRVGDDTVWADGYSDNRWRSVYVGMKRDDVYELLGSPLEVQPNPKLFGFDAPRQCPGEVVERWTRTPNNDSYSIRQLVFKGDVVVDKINIFYTD